MSHKRNKQHLQFIEQVRKLGHEVNLTNGGHYRIETPQGPVFTGASPSDHRAWKKLRSDLRRRGVKV